MFAILLLVPDNVESNSHHYCMAHIVLFTSGVVIVRYSHQRRSGVARKTRCLILRMYADFHVFVSWLNALRAVAFLVVIYFTVKLMQEPMYLTSVTFSKTGHFLADVLMKDIISLDESCLSSTDLQFDIRTPG